MHKAAWDNDVETLRRLLDEDPGLIEKPVLKVACERCAYEAAVFLIERGADVNQQDPNHGSEYHRSPLHAACSEVDVRLVSLLLRRGADPTVAAGDTMSTPLLSVSYPANVRESEVVEVMRMLLEDGRADVNARSASGRTALWWACHHAHIDVARYLLTEALADHTIAGYDGRTPMRVAQDLSGLLGPNCIPLLQWYEGELEKAYLLSRARAMVDATESITKAPEKVKAKTQAEVQRAREETAPAYLRGRVGRGEALPEVMVRQGGQRGGDEEEEEQGAVCEWLVKGAAEDLLVEVMEGVRYRRWVPGEAHGPRG